MVAKSIISCCLELLTNTQILHILVTYEEDSEGYQLLSGRMYLIINTFEYYMCNKGAIQYFSSSY